MANASLTPELEAFIQEQVTSGRYTTASEVVREGLRLLEERERIRREKLEALRRDIAVGLAQAERGEPIDGEEVFGRLRSRLGLAR